MKVMFRFRREFSSLATAFALSSMATTASAQSSLALLPNQVPSVVKQSALVSKLPSSQILHIAITLPPANLNALEAFDKSVSDPTSPNYGKFLTPEQVGAQFGPSVVNFDKVLNYLKSNGFSIKLAAKSRLAILADATAAQAETAFHTQINQYHSLLPNDPERVDFFSYSTTLKVPASIASLIQTVGGLENHEKPHPRLKKRKQAGPGYLTAITASVFYDSVGLHNNGFNGQGRTIAISNWDGFSLKNVPFYVSANNLPVPTAGVGSNITVVTIDGGSETTTAAGEGDLDIQMVLGQSPLATIMVYDGVGDDGPQDVLTKEADDNLADTLTESYGWGFDTGTQIACHTLHLQMTAQGQTYMAASGDDGVEDFLYYPQEDPLVTDVGGTSIQADINGNRISEITWANEYGASGGGWFTQSVPFNTLQSWQYGTGVPSTPNYRLFPDVALDADPVTGVQIYFGGSLQVFGGTSDASPQFAAMMADVEQYLITKKFFTPTSAGKYRFGNISPIIYRENDRSDVYYDITKGGSNGLLPNGTESLPGVGWDTITGWGSMDVYKFATTLSNKPSQTIAALSPTKIYAGDGSSATNTTVSLTGNQTSYFSEHSVPSSVGALAATYLSFQLNASPPTLASATLTFVSEAPTNTTRFIYLKNKSTGNYDLISSGAQTGGKATDKILLNLTKYDIGNFVDMVIRDVYPARLGSTPFVTKIYQATITEGF